MIAIANLPQAERLPVEEVPHRQTDIPGVTESLRVCRKCNRSYKVLALNRVVLTSGYCIPCFETLFPDKCRDEARDFRDKKFLERCPPLYQQCDPQKLPNASKFDEVMAWRRGKKGLVLIGSSQKGKTRCAWAKVKELYVEHGVGFEAVSDLQFGHQITNYGRSATLGEWTEKLCRTPVLFIDDLGKSVPTERFVSELQNIVEERVSYFKPIIVTMQITGKEWAQKLASRSGSDIAEAIINRLKAHCEVIQF
jgi:hypothetical protein